MFDSLILYGGTGSILWGYRTAAAVRSWRIAKHSGRDGKHDGKWRLMATLARADKFQLRQRPLMFTAPRDRGYWCWPLLTDSIQIGDTTLIATLGPPEQ